MHNLKKVLGTIFLGLASLPSFAGQANYYVVPLPQSIVENGGESFSLSASTPIVYTGDDADMKRQAHFLSDYINEAAGIKLTVQSNP